MLVMYIVMVHMCVHVEGGGGEKDWWDLLSKEVCSLLQFYLLPLRLGEECVAVHSKRYVKVFFVEM